MKLIKYRRDKMKCYGFQNWFAGYGKNWKKQYRIEIALDFGLLDADRFKIYQGSKRPFFRNLNIITALFLPFSPFILLSIFLFAMANKYVEGARNFIVDCAWVQDVRFFNWANIVIIFVLVAYLLFNCLS